MTTPTGSHLPVSPTTRPTVPFTLPSLTASIPFQRRSSQDTVVIPVNNPVFIQPISSEAAVFNPNHTITYQKVVSILKESYNFEETVKSTSLDILALYLKGQTVIYIESKTYCEKRLNSLMLPAIFLAAVCSILSFILKDYAYGTIIISSLNAFNSFILSIINYLKLSEKSQNHLMAARRFRELASKVELKSGRALFFTDKNDMEASLEEVEKEIKEIRSSDQFIVPEAIRHRYPKTYSANIFSLVKEIKNNEMLLINELKSAVQEIHYYTEQRDELQKREKELKVRIKTYKEKKNRLQYEKEISDLWLHNQNVFHNYDYKDKRIIGIYEEEPVNMIIHPQMELPPEMDKYEKEEANQYQARSLRAAIELSHLEVDMQYSIDQLDTVKIDLQETKKRIETYDETKNEAFDRAVRHRQKYINLSEVFHEEIDAHIESSNKSCWGPCDFFNT